jgi:hypothetical protein
MRFVNLRTVSVIALALAMASLASCAHVDLTAPCTRDSFFDWLGVAYADECGPLRSVNQ